MPETPSFVVNDRRKFTSEGELRPEAQNPKLVEEGSTPPVAADDVSKGPQLVAPERLASEQDLAPLADEPEVDALGALDSSPQENAFPDATSEDDSLPAGPTAEQAGEAARAYEATVDRLDTAMRASNPGGERMPPMSFERLVQSLYTQALILLGGGAQPGETPRVDILGARETIDMLAVLDTKSKGNLSETEQKLLESALFDLRMGFLEITQALARQAAQRQGGAPGVGAAGGFPPLGGGPRIVR